jgi:hypothetical protein
MPGRIRSKTTAAWEAPPRRAIQETTMSQQTDPERDLARTGDELEERIERLEGDIHEARHEAQARREEDSDPFEDTAGDWQDTDDDAGGDDPERFDDPDEVGDDLEDEDE